MHYVTNIKILYPFSLVQEAQNVSQINLLLVLFLLESFLNGAGLFVVGLIKVRNGCHPAVTLVSLRVPYPEPVIIVLRC